MGRKTFEDLPNELLALIFQYLVAPSNHLPLTSKHFGILTTLSQVNRRLHDFTQSFLRRNSPRHETLRLHIARGSVDPKRRQLPPLFAPNRYSGITTLALHDRRGTSDALDQCLRSSFRSLRVLRMEHLSAPASLVYDFIQRHPTIREANIHFVPEIPTHSLRFAPLMELIHGTGTWIAPEGSKAVADQPLAARTFDTYDVHLVPPEWPENYGFFYRFAFARRPIVPHSSETLTSSIGTKEARYECTSLAISFLEEEDDILPATYQPIDTFMEKMHTTLPALQELRLFTRAELENGDDFTSFMARVEASMRQWTNLRKLSFFQCNYYPEITWTPPPEDEEVEFGVELPEGAIRILDEPHPDIWVWELLGELREGLATLGQVLSSRYPTNLDPSAVRAAIRRALRLDDDATLDEDDPQLLMTAWEAHNYPRVARLVRKIAEACPTLEELDWYTHHATGPAHDGLRAWDILREASGEVRMVNGTLTWAGCVRGDVFPPPIYVGQELEYTRGSGGR